MLLLRKGLILYVCMSVYQVIMRLSLYFTLEKM